MLKRVSGSEPGYEPRACRHACGRSGDGEGFKGVTEVSSVLKRATVLHTGRGGGGGPLKARLPAGSNEDEVTSHLVQADCGWFPLHFELVWAKLHLLPLRQPFSPKLKSQHRDLSQLASSYGFDSAGEGFSVRWRRQLQEDEDGGSIALRFLEFPSKYALAKSF